MSISQFQIQAANRLEKLGYKVEIGYKNDTVTVFNPVHGYIEGKPYGLIGYDEIVITSEAQLTRFIMKRH